MGHFGGSGRNIHTYIHTYIWTFVLYLEILSDLTIQAANIYFEVGKKVSGNSVGTMFCGL